MCGQIRTTIRDVTDDVWDADNAIAGRIKGPKGSVGEISGKWSDVMDIQRKNVRAPSLSLARYGD